MTRDTAVADPLSCSIPDQTCLDEDSCDENADEPVCGVNGIDYPNPCTAECSGVR